MWHNRRVSGSILQTLITVCALLSVAVFVAAFKFALREVLHSRSYPFEPEIPPARLHALSMRSSNQWHRGVGKQTIVRHLQIVQAGFVAIGITSVFIMFICMAGVVGMMILGAW